jgi:hypothetical protein
VYRLCRYVASLEREKQELADSFSNMSLEDVEAITKKKLIHTVSAATLTGPISQLNTIEKCTKMQCYIMVSLLSRSLRAMG